MSQARSSRFRRVGPYLLVVLAALCILGAALGFARVPELGTQLNTLPTAITVTISQPVDQSHWDLYSPISVSARATGRRVEALQLWVDGVQQQTARPRNGRASWTWPIQDTSQHTLLVRALDAQGHAFNSNVVRVTGVVNPSPSMNLLYPVKPGDTVAGIAAKFGTTPEKITAVNAPPDKSALLPSGAKIKIPVSFHPGQQPANNPSPPPQPAPNGPTQPPSPNLPNNVVFWASKFLNEPPPTAPDLGLQIDGCTADLRIADTSANENGFSIYRQDPNSESFKRIASIGPNLDRSVPIKYQDANLSGSFSYYVAAFDAGGESQSNVVTANVAGANCQSSAFWSGMASAFKNQIGLVTSQYDKVYFYLSEDGGVRQRIPQDEKQFLSLSNGVFDLNKQIAALAPQPQHGTRRLDIDVWGWAGGSLVHIGDFQKVLTAPKTGSSRPPTQLQICEVASCKSDVAQYITLPTTTGAYVRWDFQWKSDPSGATQGLVQVSTVAFDRVLCSLKPAGLIAEAQQTITARGKDFAPFVIHFDAPGVVQAGPAFFIRVLPVVDGQPVCQPSNMIEFSVGPIPTFTIPTVAPLPDPYDIKILDVSNFQFGDPSRAYCVHVVKNIFYVAPADRGGRSDADWATYQEQNWLNNGADPVSAHWRALWSLWPVGSEPCPGTYVPPDESVIQQGVDLAMAEGKMLADGLNSASAWYAGAEDSVVNQVADATGICNAGVVDPQTCTDDLHAGLSAGLAALGIPPSIPNWGQVVDVGKGQIADAAVSTLSADGYCPDEDACRKLIESGLDAALANIQANGGEIPLSGPPGCMSEEEANARGIEPMCISPVDKDSIVITNVPEASDQPSIAQVQVLRRADVPDSALPPTNFSCFATIGSTGVNLNWIFKTNIPVGWDNYTWPGGVELSGQLFDDAQLTIPSGMSPGETRTLLTALTPSGFWVPDPPPYTDGHYWNQYELDGGSPQKSEDDWDLLYRGAKATFTATETCSHHYFGGVYPNLNGVLKDTLNQTIPGP